MASAWRYAALSLAALNVAAPQGALAGDAPRILYQATLDMDGDGVADLAAVTNAGGSADLAIYLHVGDAGPALSRPPNFLRKNLTTERVLDLKGGPGGALVVVYGCGGCSNDHTTTLTIVHQGGSFVVNDAVVDWDTRYGIGTCRLDFEAGQGIVSKGLAEDERKEVPIAVDRGPINLADWSDEVADDACGL
jgi:hypothetical protein